MEPINKDAVYIKIGSILVDCHDIVKLELLGYEPKEGTNQPDEDRPVYRIYFNDNTHWENYIDKESVMRYNEFVEKGV